MFQERKMRVNVKKLEAKAVIPSKANKGDAGLDLTAVSVKSTAQYIEYGIGLSIAIPEGYMGLIFPRSSISDRDIGLANSVGVIDSGYRGELKVRFKYAARESGFPPRHAISTYRVGERVAQLVIVPIPDIELVEGDLDEKTERSVGGFGSSDKPKSKVRSKKKVSKDETHK